MDEDNKFESKDELQDWLKSRGIGEDCVAGAADTLFTNGFNKPSRLLGISKEMLKEEGLSNPVAMELSNKLEKIAPVQLRRDDGVVAGLTAQFQQASIHNKTSNSPVSSTPMPDLFVDTKNTRPRDMLLDRLKNLEKDDSEYAPFLAIVQSSGYGKTRMVLEVARVRRVVYLLCNNIKGGLQSPLVVTEFVKRIAAAHSTELRERRADKFLGCVVQCAKSYNSVEQLFDAQFTKEATFGDFYGRLEKAVEDAEAPPTSPLKTDNVEAPPSSSPPESLVVVFDEALCLTENEEHNRDSPYRCIRRLLKLHGLDWTIP